MSKLTALIRRAPKRFAAVAVIVAAAILIPASLLAWGPSRQTFTTANPADYITFNSITDNPVHGDERNFMQVREATASNTTYADSINLAAGKEYVVYMYYHNNAAANLNLVATGSYAKAQIPAVVAKGSTGTKAMGYVGATNAEPKQVWDDISFKNSTGADIALRYVPGSTTIHNLGDANGKTMADSIVTTGAPLGHDQLDGKIPGCNEFAGYVTFRVKADQPNFTVSKQVRKTGTTTWGEQVEAKNSETVDFQIAYKNTGTTQQNDVVITDKLPAGLEYVPGSSWIMNGNYPSGKNVSDNVVTSGGLNIGHYAPGGAGYVKFTAKVKLGELPCGEKTLTNVAYAYTANGNKHDDAKVLIKTICEEEVKIKVCELATKNIITINEDDFDATKHSKNLADCDEEVKTIKVCELASYKIITIDEEDFDATKHSKNLDDCKEEVKTIKVCELSTKKIITINETDYDSNKHSKDFDDCAKTPEVPPELPTTGIAENVMAVVGLGALIASIAYYVASRRALA